MEQVLEVSYDGGLPPGFLTAVGGHGVRSAEDSRWKNTIRDDIAQDGSFLRVLLLQIVEQKLCPV